MTIKTVKLQLEHSLDENARLNELIIVLKEKITILEEQIGILQRLNYIQEKYNIPGN